MNRRQESVSTPQNRTNGDREQGSIERALNHLDSKNSQKIYEALTFIKKRVTKGVEEIVKFRRFGGIEKLLSVITKINSKLLEFVLSILNSCCSEEKSCYKFAQCDGVNILADDVIKLLTTEMLCHRFCRLIGSLAVYDSCRILIHDRQEIVESVAGFLKDETDNEFKQAICKAIRLLSDTEGHQLAILRWQAVKSVALQLKTSVNDVIMTALKTVAHFMKRCTEECIRQLVVGETIQSLVMLTSKNDNRDISSYSMSLLLRISRDANFCQYLGTNGAVELFIRTSEILMELAISKRRQKKVRQLFHVVNALCRCCRGSRNRKTMQEFGGINLLVQVLKTDQLAPVYDRVISGLACFVYYEEGLESLLQMNVFEVLIQQLYRCAQPKPIQSSVARSGNTDIMDNDDDEEDDEDGDAVIDEAAGFQAGEEEMDFREEQRLEFEAIGDDAAGAGERDISADVVARCFPAGEEEVNFVEEQRVEFESVAKDAVDDEVTALTSMEEKLEIDAKRGTSLPRYSIHSPTYQAVLQEQRPEDTDEVRPRNMWEGIELYGGSRYMSPVTANSPLRSSSLGSSPIREVYSPLSMSSRMSSESPPPPGGLSPRSDDAGVNLDLGWSPCISDESRLSPVERVFDMAAAADSCNVVYSPRCSSYDLPGNESEYFASVFSSVDAKMEIELAGKDVNKSDSSKGSEEGVLADEGIASMKEMLYEEGIVGPVEGAAFEVERIVSDAKDGGLSMYCSPVFTKNRFYDQMLVKYTNVFEDDIIPATTLEEQTKKPEKRQRSVSLETLRKIKKTVAGDISMSSRSCIDLEQLSGQCVLPTSSTSAKQEMSRESITAFNILLIMSRAYDFGISNNAFCSRRIVQGLLDYIVRAEPPTERALGLLLRLTENRMCFEALIRNGIPSLFSEVLNPDLPTDLLVTKNRDGNSACSGSNEDKGSEKSGEASCASNDEKVKMSLTQRFCICENLYCNLSTVAQTEYGKTVLGHLLKYGNQSEKEHCVVELCHIMRSDTMKKQVLLKMGGLKLLIDILKNPQTNLFRPAVRWICCLARELSIVDSPFKNKPGEGQTSVEHEKKVIDATNDVSFVFENGISVNANRAEMAASSQVFAALLEGQFAEAKMSVIPVSHTSAEAFQMLIYIIRCESVADGIVRLNKPNDVAAISDVLLAVLRLANHYLMPGVCESVGRYICQEFLNEDNVEEVFSMCIALSCPLTPFQCVKYILCKLPLQQCCQVLANIAASDWFEDFLRLVTNILSERLICIKELISLVCRKSQS